MAGLIASVGSALGVLAVPIVVLYFIGMGIFTLSFPWLWMSALRNVKLIRLEMQRLNEILDSRLTADAPTLPRR